MKIDDFSLGEGTVFIVAELSANHANDINIAKETIRAAARCGADAIKLQTYRADSITLKSDNEYFKIKQETIWDGRTLYELYKEASLPYEWHKELFATAKEEGLICFSSPFDRKAVDFLEELETPAYKVASFEITDIPLIEHMAKKQKPIIISTGIATLEDIELAVQTCRDVGNDQIILLKCTSAYPAEPSAMNLKTMQDLSKRFHVLSGLSDHTLGITAPVAATALGAVMIEKHFILDRSIGGADSSFSLDESEFTLMVQAVRETQKLLGGVTYELNEKTKRSREFSRSLFVAKEIKKGELFSEENIRSVRPGFGLHPKNYNQILGKRAAKNLKRATPLKLEDIIF